MSLKLFGTTGYQIDLENIDLDKIQKIAEAILLQHVIVIGDTEYQIAEIEFYIKSPDHNDQYTHGDVNQKKYGKWYFHRYANGSYKGGTYKGLDLTLGNDRMCFGVLIRSIYCPENDLMIEGPCRTVNKILELCGCSDVGEYMEGRKDPLSARSTKNFYIKRKARPLDETMHTGPRIGLSDKYPEWRDVNYRYVIRKSLIKKEKKKLVEL